VPRVIVEVVVVRRSDGVSKFKLFDSGVSYSSILSSEGLIVLSHYLH
jgi:hypothetical protein